MSDAITVTSDMKIYEAEFNAGVFEALYQNSNVFNQASNNAITLITQVHPGNYIKNAYFGQVSNLVTRQDITSVAAVDSKKLSQVEEAAVKLHQKIGPVQFSKKAFNMAGLQTPGIDTPVGSMIFGRLIGDAVLQRMVTLALTALKAAVAGQSASLRKDVTGESTKNATFSYLNQTRAKWGDQMFKNAAWIMNSKPFTDIIGDGLANYAFDSVGGVLVPQGNISQFLGAAPVVTDNAALITSGTPNTYSTLGLAEMAAVVRQSELTNIVIKTHTGFEQLLFEVQGEMAITLGIQGFTWDVANGGANPTDAYLGTSDYWDKVRTDTTGLPIVELLSQ